MTELNVRQLEIFRAVVNTGSVSAAARMLYVSQPAVTKTLKNLETSLDLKLFQRTKGRLLCTPEAATLLPEVERLFGSMESVSQLATEIRDGMAGRITIGAPTTIAASLIPHAIKIFVADHPKVVFDVRALPTRHVVDYVTTGQVDIGILDVPTPTDDLQVEEFGTAELVAVLKSAHPLARHACLGPAELAGQMLVSFGMETSTGWLLREAFRRCGYVFKPALMSNNTSTACSMVNQLDAIALVDPFTLLSGAYPDLVARRFEPQVKIQPRFLFPTERPRSLILRQFVDVIRSIAGEDIRAID
ncbi:LysR substrate-binding domain-containing protein [Salinisphaera sp. T31B1]|uniref:LysR family transcriptional regulator n=1 Tax=Salinisphaera sp. T31B1 TaxID=727963 RepID=UPI00333EF0DA